MSPSPSESHPAKNAFSREREDLRPWFQTLDDIESPLDWSRFYGNSHPVEIDIGCGRGLFLYNVSETNPETNYLGLEIDFKEGRRAAKRLKKVERSNARILGGDAKRALSEFIPRESVAAIHVYFPDPWWKAKHHKRRLFTAQFAQQVDHTLEPGVLLHGWTDVFDYWEFMTGHINEIGHFKELPAPEERFPQHNMDYQTSFERKKRLAGWPIYRGLWQKPDPGLE